MGAFLDKIRRKKRKGEPGRRPRAAGPGADEDWWPGQGEQPLQDPAGKHPPADRGPGERMDPRD